MTHPIQHVHVAIIGSGFGGLGAAIRLQQEGETGFLIFERAAQLGGVWRDNHYPGCACDVPSHLYSFSFAPNPYWSHRFSAQPEIWRYLQHTAAEFGVEPHLRLNHEVREAVWCEPEAHWRIETSQGVYTANLLVAAAGALSEPYIPNLPGLDSFEGRAFHSACWPDDLDLTGQRVAVVGTGASAIQIIPAIQPQVSRLTVFQRTPPWVMPRNDRALSRRVGAWLARVPWLRQAARGWLYVLLEARGLAFRHLWLARLAQRGALRLLESQVADPDLRARLTPTYMFGCKRVLLSDDYYPALTQANVELVDGAAVAARPRGLVGADGLERPADVIVFGAGFQVTEFPFATRLRGRDGVRLADVWRGSPQAHLGTTVAGFPNLFILQGPNTGLGHTSVILMIEAQIEHMVHALQAMRARGLAAVEPRPEAQAAFVAEVDRAMQGTVWTSGGCRSWYLDATGRNSTLWPGSVGSFRRRVEPFRPDEYRLRPAGDPSPTPPPQGGGARGGGLSDAVRGAIARWLGGLPPGVQTWLSGRPSIQIDGQRLDPTLQLLMTLRPPGELRPLTAGSPEQARARHRQEVLALRDAPTPVGAVRDLTVEGAAGPLQARHYTPPADALPDAPPSLLVYYHGGGFTIGDLDTLDEACRLLCLHGRRPVLSVAYRLAPEHPYPAALDDALAAFRWAQAHAAELGVDARCIAVGGDSAGGNLAAAVAQRAAGHNPPLAQLLIYPTIDRATPRPSAALFDGFFLTVADRDQFSDYYYRATGTSDADPGVSPLLAADLAGLPPAMVVTAGFDILRDEGAAYAYALQAAGTPCLLQRESPLTHGFIQLTGVSRACYDATLRLARSWRAFLKETA